MVDGKEVSCPESIARYAFWPSYEDRLPLLNICAIILLCHSKAASTLNEGFHSVATYILKESRRSLTTQKAEALCLMRAILPKYLMKHYLEFQQLEADAVATGYLDVDEVERILERDAVLADDEVKGGVYSIETESAADSVFGLEELVEDEEGEGCKT